MAAIVEIERALATITATLNDHRVEHLEPERVQQLVDDAIGEAGVLTVDPGGGLHDRSGVRVGAVRRSPSGEWIAERQNDAAERSDTAVPRVADQGGPLRRLLAKLKS
jgi:hypothetical protein